MIRVIGVALLAATFVIVPSTHIDKSAAAASQDDSTPDYQGTADDANDELTTAARLEREQALLNGSGDSDADDNIRYYRATVHYCLVDDLEGTVLREACEEGRETIADDLDCPEDAHELAGLFAVTLNDDGIASEPRVVSPGACVTPADLQADAEHAFRTMDVHAAPIQLEIDRDWAIVNFGIHPRTTADPQTLDTTLLGIPVQIRALPVEYTWDPGDGTEPLVTDHPGGPYDSPAAIELPYPAPGTYTATLTTTWHGQFRITGTPTWTDIDGQLTTTDTTDPIEVHDAEVRLTS